MGFPAKSFGVDAQKDLRGRGVPQKMRERVCGLD